MTELQYIPADLDDDAWLPREEAMQAFQEGDVKDSPAKPVQKMPENMPRPKSTRVELLHFFVSLSLAELDSWLREGHVRVKG